MICPNCGTRLSTGITLCHFCGYESPLGSDNEQSQKKIELFLTKFIALFTLFALAISISFFLYTTMELKSLDKSLVAIISICGGFLLTFFYLIISPWLIQKLFDDMFHGK